MDVAHKVVVGPVGEWDRAAGGPRTARRGARVAAVDIREESLNETTKLAGAADRLATFVVDITDRAATDALPEKGSPPMGR